MADNTLLGRCLVAYEEAFDQEIGCWPDVSARRRGIASVLDHLAAEIIVLHQREPRLTVHELARVLTLEAAGELAGWVDDDDNDHPSLTAEERNPSLR